MAAPTADLLVVSASFSLTQSSQGLRSRYGEPDIERFPPAPDVGLTVEYGSDSLACQLVIEEVQTPNAPSHIDC